MMWRLRNIFRESAEKKEKRLANMFWALSAKTLEGELKEFKDKNPEKNIFSISLLSGVTSSCGVAFSSYSVENMEDAVKSYIDDGGKLTDLRGFKKFHQAAQKQNVCVMPLEQEEHDIGMPRKLMGLTMMFGISMGIRIKNVHIDVAKPYAQSPEAEFWKKKNKALFVGR